MIEHSSTVFAGRIITVNVERVRLPNERVADLEIIHHPGGAAVLALDAQQRICLLNQYRHATGGWLWELPAGKIDQREPHLQTAQRELHEEAGCTAAAWHYLGEVVSSPGVFTEVVHLYLATQLTHSSNQPEEHEVFTVTWHDFDTALAMARRGEIRDGKTLAALLLAQPHLNNLS